MIYSALCSMICVSISIIMSGFYSISFIDAGTAAIENDFNSSDISGKYYGGIYYYGGMYSIRRDSSIHSYTSDTINGNITENILSNSINCTEKILSIPLIVDKTNITISIILLIGVGLIVSLLVFGCVCMVNSSGTRANVSGRGRREILKCRRMIGLIYTGAAFIWGIFWPIAFATIKNIGLNIKYCLITNLKLGIASVVFAELAMICAICTPLEMYYVYRQQKLKIIIH